MKSVLLQLALGVVATIGIIALIAWGLAGPPDDPVKAERERRALAGEWLEINPLPDGTPCWERVHVVNAWGTEATIVVCRGEP